MRLGFVEDLSEHVRRDDVDLVQQEETPLASADLLHDFQALGAALTPEGDHRVGRNRNARKVADL